MWHGNFVSISLFIFIQYVGLSERDDKMFSLDIIMWHEMNLIWLCSYQFPYSLFYHHVAGLSGGPELASSVFTLATTAVLPFYTLMIVAPNSELVCFFWYLGNIKIFSFLDTWQYLLTSIDNMHKFSLLYAEMQCMVCFFPSSISLYIFVLQYQIVCLVSSESSYILPPHNQDQTIHILSCHK